MTCSSHAGEGTWRPSTVFLEQAAARQTATRVGRCMRGCYAKMELRALGGTGVIVSALGLGAGPVGELSEMEAAALLGGALDLGVSLIDTARSYGASEERIGRHLAHRRGEFVLSTKCGYGIEGVPDWTGECIDRGVDEALRRLRTDRVDVMHLHSCPLDVLR